MYFHTFMKIQRISAKWLDEVEFIHAVYRQKSEMPHESEHHSHHSRRRPDLGRLRRLPVFGPDVAAAHREPDAASEHLAHNPAGHHDTRHFAEPRFADDAYNPVTSD